VKDIELAADIGLGILLGTMRGISQRRVALDVIPQALDAAYKALGVFRQPTDPA
jgi:hypothetical protein